MKLKKLKKIIIRCSLCVLCAVSSFPLITNAENYYYKAQFGTHIFKVKYDDETLENFNGHKGDFLDGFFLHQIKEIQNDKDIQSLIEKIKDKNIKIQFDSQFFLGEDTGAAFSPVFKCIKIPYSSASSMNSNLSQFKNIIKHELTHQYIHSEVGIYFPKWLDEGFATQEDSESYNASDLKGYDFAKNCDYMDHYPSDYKTKHQFYAFNCFLIKDWIARGNTLDDMLNYIQSDENFKNINNQIEQNKKGNVEQLQNQKRIIVNDLANDYFFNKSGGYASYNEIIDKCLQ